MCRQSKTSAPAFSRGRHPRVLLPQTALHCTRRPMRRRVLVATQCGSDGVILPHLAIAQALARRGHRVWFYAPKWAAVRARAAGCMPLEMPVGDAYRAFVTSRPGGEVSSVLYDLAWRVAPHLLKALSRLRIDTVVT